MLTQVNGDQATTAFLDFCHPASLVQCDIRNYLLSVFQTVEASSDSWCERFGDYFYHIFDSNQGPLICTQRYYHYLLPCLHAVAAAWRACRADTLLHFIVSISFTLLTFAFQRVRQSLILGVGNIRRLLLPCFTSGRGSLGYLVGNITTTNCLCTRFPKALGEQV